ncbi:MAG: STAS domain-containing protein [Cellvibrionaceae bacterium]|nr:STAS domain-containing protein [Cellvibrionaceae bacterium]
MSKPKKSAPVADHLALRGELTIYSADTVRAQILECLQKGAELELDLREVTGIDSAGVQILMAAKLEAHKFGGDVRLVGHSQSVFDVFELLNLSAFFGDPVLLTGDANRSSP